MIFLHEALTLMEGEGRHKTSVDSKVMNKSFRSTMTYKVAFTLGNLNVVGKN
jgi:hypothetical protein